MRWWPAVWDWFLCSILWYSLIISHSFCRRPILNQLLCRYLLFDRCPAYFTTTTCAPQLYHCLLTTCSFVYLFIKFKDIAANLSDILFELQMQLQQDPLYLCQNQAQELVYLLANLMPIIYFCSSSEPIWELHPIQYQHD